jgi:hypothetical protein
MKHVTYANKSMFMDDDAADLLAEYAAVLGTNAQADTVEIHAVGIDGNEVDVTFVLNSSSDLVVETTNSEMVPPINDAAVAQMREAIRRLTAPAEIQPQTERDGLRPGQYIDDF